MATDGKGTIKHSRYLSLTGRLFLQEKKEKRGKFSFSRKKQNAYWFWFDEKECSLKYYKNQQCYQTSLHNFEGSIDLKHAKVTPSEVCAEDTGASSDIFTNETFLIFTVDGGIFALTADSDIACHQWIKKLQEKRATWDKKEKAQPKPINVEFLSAQDGLIHEQGSKKAKQDKSHVQKIFEDFLGSDQLHLSTTSIPQFRHIDPHSKDNTETDGPGDIESYQLLSSDSTGDTSDSTTDTTLTIDRKQVLKLQIRLSKSSQVNEKLRQKIVSLQDEIEKYRKLEQQRLNEIEELLETVHKLKGNISAEDLQIENDSLHNVINQLKRSFRSIDGEIELYKQQLKDRDKKIQEGIQKQKELENCLLEIKILYVSLLDSSFKIPILNIGAMETEETDPMEEKLKSNLLNLIKKELSSDSTLFDVSGDVFEDKFGELHDWKNDSNIHHYLCRQLHLHYTEYDQQMVIQEWYNYVAGFKVSREKFWEIPTESSKGKRRELRNFLRKGVPNSIRAKMWASLVNFHVGKMREFNNLTAKGGNYYQSLLTTPSQMLKGIQTDIHRTIPNNKHFKENAIGCVKLERVLIAYSNHNRNIGYCQGINMIAAIGLLYLDEETTFWYLKQFNPYTIHNGASLLWTPAIGINLIKEVSSFQRYLVAIAERLLPPYYFSNGLSSVRADQTVMQELVSEKLQGLKGHLDDHGIDLTIVTFRWFLTLFVDGLPTESVLRVIDCFLLEGRKLSFRLSLAIFKLNEDRILSLTDPVTIFMMVKEISKHIYNMDELFQVAFNEFNPFPTRSTIKSRCKPYIKEYLAEWKERESMKDTFTSVFTPPPTFSLLTSISVQKYKKQLKWECGTNINSKEVWLCSGDRDSGRLCIIKSIAGQFDIKSPNIDVGSKILCIRAFSNNIVMVGTLDFTIHAISIKSMKELWSMKLNDTVLDFVWHQENLICALADGYISTLITMGDLPLNNPILYRIGNIAVQCMVRTKHNHIWIGCGKAITILEIGTYEPVRAIVTPDKAGKVYKMEQSDHGIWITFKNSSVLCLYDTEHLIELLQIDHSSLLPITPDDKPLLSVDCRITALTVFNDTLWIATGNGSIHVFKLSSTYSDRRRQIVQLSDIDNFEHIGTVQSVNTEDDMGLLSKARKESFTLPTRRQTKTTSNINIRRQNKATLFGDGFRKRSRQEATGLDNCSKEDDVYKMKHLWSSKVFPGHESLRVTVVKPIRHGDKQLFISCLNSGTVGDQAVQLWEQNISDDAIYEWSYTTLSECHTVVAKDITYNPTHTDERRRSQSTIMMSPSTIIGSLSPTESLLPDNLLIQEEIEDDILL